MDHHPGFELQLSSISITDKITILCLQFIVSFFVWQSLSTTEFCKSILPKLYRNVFQWKENETRVCSSDCKVRTLNPSWKWLFDNTSIFP